MPTSRTSTHSQNPDVLRAPQFHQLKIAFTISNARPATVPSEQCVISTVYSCSSPCAALPTQLRKYQMPSCCTFTMLSIMLQWRMFITRSMIFLCNSADDTRITKALQTISTSFADERIRSIGYYLRSRAVYYPRIICNKTSSTSR